MTFLKPFFASVPLIDPDAFLRQEVETASPAKLRWLLIRKAIGLCQATDQLWEERRWSDASQWIVRIRDIFCELLDGVTDPQNPAAQPIADLYTFLLKLLAASEAKQDRQELSKIVDILQIELGTWELYVHRESQNLDFQNSSQGLPIPTGISSDYATSEWSGFNVEA